MGESVSIIITRLQILLSGIIIAGINIILSGYLWGSILSLEKNGEDYFYIPIPPILGLKIRGQQVIAGLTAFTISLLLVGIFLHNAAHHIFITNLQCTNNQLLACELLATSLSVVLCAFVLMVKSLMIYYKLMNIKESFISDEQLVRTLIAVGKEEEKND
jgi:hypothetical protein